MTTEIQQVIIQKEEDEKVSEEEFYSMLKLIAPGTNLRKALEGILHSGKGALIAIENEHLAPLIDGGFRLNCKFSYQKLIEISKMDGAIILSKDLKRIMFANVLLTPNSKIRTSETGTRHKAGERTAKQISGLVIAISERKKEIMLFYKNRKYKIKESGEIIRKASDYIQVLERQRELFDHHLENLNKMELKNYVNLNNAIKTIQKGKTIQKISEELKKYLIELGDEGKLLKTRLKEILSNVEDETNLIIKDYSNIEYKIATTLLEELSYDELLDKERIVKILGHENVRKIMHIAGWRILSKTSLSEPEIAGLIKESGNLEIINTSDISTGVGLLPPEKFAILKVEIERMKLGI
ncbi:MAG: DNA integrity scanning diadenylate cyclase DisA [Nanoarchaeota archaeon]